MPIGIILAVGGAAVAATRRLEQKDRWNAIGIIGLILVCAALKDGFKYSPGMKEYFAKHYHMYTCVYMHHFRTRIPYKHEDQDFFIISFGRSGTMLVVNLFHQLRTGGDPDFDDIMYVGRHYTPAMGNAHINDKQSAWPRMFWSHGWPGQVPMGERYIYVNRNIKDVGLSWRQFVTDFYTMTQEIPVDEYFFECMGRNCAIPQDHWFTHVALWWEYRRKNPKVPVGWFHFEKTALSDTDMETAVGAGEEFLHLDLNSTTRSKVKEYISLDFWRENQKKFDIHGLMMDHLTTINSCMNMPQFLIDINRLGVNSVRKTVEAQHKMKPAISPAVKEFIHRKWSLRVEPVTGYESYEEMIQNSEKHRWKSLGKYD